MQSEFNLFLNLVKDEVIGTNKVKNYLNNHDLSEKEIERLVETFKNYKIGEELINYLVEVFPNKYLDLVLCMYLNHGDLSLIKYIYDKIYNKNWDLFLNFCNIVAEKGNSIILFLALNIDKMQVEKDAKKDILSKLENALIKTDDKWAIIKFAEYISTANIEKFQDYIVQSKDAKLINQFKLINRDGIDFSKLEDAIIEINDIDGIIDFAKDEHANVERLEEIVLSNGKIKDIRKFAGLYGANIKMIDNYFKENSKRKKIGKYDYEYWLSSSEKKAFDILYNFVNKYFKYEITSIKEGLDIIYSDLFVLIDSIGLVHLYEEIKDLDKYFDATYNFNFRKNTLFRLYRMYPEKQEILQVYYYFLILPRYNLSDLNLDDEYRQIMLSNGLKDKVKKL